MQNPSHEYLTKKRNLQMQMFIKEADYKKGEQKKIQMENDVAALKKKKSQIELEIIQKENELKKQVYNQVSFFNELKKLKKQINDLRE